MTKTNTTDHSARPDAGGWRHDETAVPEYQTYYLVLEGEPTFAGGPLRRLTPDSVIRCAALSPVWPGLDKRVAHWPDGTLWFVPVEPTDEELLEAYRLAQALEGLKGAIYGAQLAAEAIAREEQASVAGEG